MRTREKLRWNACSLAVALGVLVGCGSRGPDLGKVTGVVSLDQKPLPDALVQFQPATGRPSMGRTDERGRYELSFSEGLKGAVPGEHMVRVSTAVVRWNEKAQDERAAPETVPTRYNRQTELTAVVSLGNNTIDFELQSDKK